MKLFHWSKDGGPDSNVWGLYIPEIKRLFSVVLLRFQGNTRETYHSHAFHSIAWVLKGWLLEERIDGTEVIYYPRLRPYFFPRNRFHRVSTFGNETTWVLNLRGSWCGCWFEYDPHTQDYRTLTHSRKVIG